MIPPQYIDRLEWLDSPEPADKPINFGFKSIILLAVVIPFALILVIIVLPYQIIKEKL